MGQVWVDPVERGAIRRGFEAVRAYFPRGNTLDDEAFRRRHLLLCWVLGLHVPGLFAFGVWQGVGVDHAVLEVLAPAACLVCAYLGRARRRWAAFFVAAGLVYCSSVLVHLSHGSIEAHFHFFILIGLIALYQDWVPFLWNAVFTVISHGIGGTLDPERMYNHPAGQNRPWAWALIHGLSVLAACIGVLVFWRSTEKEQGRSRQLATELARSELATVQAEAERRRSMSQLLVNLARRNQSLLNRQLSLIAELEQREVEPDALANLFVLDHVATRIRRNAESLLVLSGDEPPRRWGQPVPLPEVVRAAAAEVEEYRRVDIVVDERLEVVGRAVADLAHLIAELIENATQFSPPSSRVRVRSHLSPSLPPVHVISVEDTGIGMSEASRRAANEVLRSIDDTGVLDARLGFHVVNRLARRYGLKVQLAETPGGGITALVTLPSDLVTVRGGQPVPVAAGAVQGGSRMTPAAVPAPAPVPSRPPAITRPVASAAPVRPFAPTVEDTSTLVRTAAEVLSGPAVIGPGATTREHPVPGFLVTGRHTFPPPPPPPPLPPSGGAPEPESVPNATDDRPRPPANPARPSSPARPASPASPGPSLTRRVPGEALAAAREAAAEPDAGDGRVDPATRAHSRDRARSMLSRFQAGQRAGRAESEARTDDPRPEGPGDEEEEGS